MNTQRENHVATRRTWRLFSSHPVVSRSPPGPAPVVPKPIKINLKRTVISVETWNAWSTVGIRRDPNGNRTVVYKTSGWSQPQKTEE